MRVTLTGPTTYYLSPTGNDSADGLTAATPWRTRQYAWDYAVANIDCAGHRLTFQMLDGNYTDEFAASGSPIGIGGAKPIFTGNPSNWWNVFISTQNSAFWGFQRAVFDIRNVRLRSANADCIFSEWYSHIDFSNIAFDTAGASHINSSKHGWAFTVGGYDVWGDAPVHATASNFGNTFLSDSVVNFRGGRNFQVVAKAIAQGQVGSHTMTFNGAVTGKRYEATHCSMVGGLGGPNYWPGTIAGTVDSTSSYL